MINAENEVRDFFSIGGGFEQSKFVEVGNYDELVILDLLYLIAIEPYPVQGSLGCFFQVLVGAMRALCPALMCFLEADDVNV